jgi:hypothetical protein
VSTVQAAALVHAYNPDDMCKDNTLILLLLLHFEHCRLPLLFYQACKNPLGSVEYLSSPSFASDLVALCHSVRAQFEQETRCLFMQSPVYVFGDIHGESHLHKSILHRVHT